MAVKQPMEREDPENGKRFLEDFAQHLVEQGANAEVVQRDVAEVRRFAAWFEQVSGETFDPADMDVGWRQDLLRTYALEIQPAVPFVGTEERTRYTIALQAVGRFFHWATSTGLLESDPSKGLQDVARAKVAPESRVARQRTASRDVQEQLRRLRILNDIACTLNQTVHLQEALGETLERVVELMNLRTGWVFVQIDDPILRRLIGSQTARAAHHFFPVASVGLPPALCNDDAWPLRAPPHCWCQDRFTDGHLVRAVNVVECSRLLEATGDKQELKFHASVPILSRQQRFGIMNVATTDWSLFSADDLALLSAVGAQLSVAVERARLFNENAQLATVEERNRLAREIHDSLAQGLTALSLQLEAADALLPEQPDRAQGKVRKALALAQQTLEEARRSVLDLRAAPLEGRTLPDALADLAREFAQAQGIQAIFRKSGYDVALPTRVEVGLYRILQEALTNVGRHARATNVAVELTADAENVRLTIADNGQGFDPALLQQEKTAGHFGLLGIGERVRMLGGTVEVQTGLDAGTRLEVVVPSR